MSVFAKVDGSIKHAWKPSGQTHAQEFNVIQWTLVKTTWWQRLQNLQGG